MIDLKLELQHDEGTRSGGTNLSKMTPGGQLQKSGGAAALPDGAEPERLNIKNSVQTNGDLLDYDYGRGHKVARVCCHLRRHAILSYPHPILSYPILSYPIRLLSASYIRRHHPIQRLPCTTSQRYAHQRAASAFAPPARRPRLSSAILFGALHSRCGQYSKMRPCLPQTKTDDTLGGTKFDQGSRKARD